jgi:tetratricopeptide (TPR) repeat protein
MKRAFLLCVVLLFSSCPPSWGEEFHDAQLNRGIRNSDAYADLLMSQAREHRHDAVVLLNSAISHSPDLPSPYFELAKAKFSLSYSGILDSVDYIRRGLNAYARNFWWSFSILGSVFFSLVLSFISAFFVIICIRSFRDLPLLAHDLIESQRMGLLLPVLPVLSLLSPLLFLAGVLLLLGLYMARADRLVVYLFLAFLIVSPVLFKTASMFANAPSSGRIKAIVDVNESRRNTYGIMSLKPFADVPSLFSYALALKREGSYSEALQVFQALTRAKADAQAYVNLGNCYVGMNMLDDAIQNYRSAIAMRPLASAYYNLSGVSRELFDFAKGNEYFIAALEIDRYAVSAYRSIYGRHPNRIVIDETLSGPALWDVARTSTNETSTFNITLVPVWLVSLAAAFLMAAFAVLSSRLKIRAYRCRRCASIFCPRCEKHIMWGQMCQQCYRSLVKLDELEVRERVARLLTIYDHQKRRRNILKLLSFVIPGASQVYGGRILYGFLLMWPFLFFVLLPFTNIMLAPSALVSHGFLSWLSFLLAFVLFVLSNMFTRQRIAKGWL